jgi:inner membrane protein
MPTVMTHAVVGVGLGVLYTRETLRPIFWLTVVGLAMIPDLDVWAFRLGIPYDAPFGHRGFSHSLFFALLAGALAAYLLRQWMPGRFLDRWGFFFAVTASHGILDGFTNGGRGVAYFAPFYNRRFFFPWTPIEVSNIGLSFFGPRGLTTILSEMLWVWLPTAVIVGAVLLYRWLTREQS